MSKKTVMAAGVVAALAASVALAKGPGILFPEWSKPTMGTFQAPAKEAGEKAEADQPWSTTTMASSIMGKPLKGKPVSMVGEIIDVSCYLQVGKRGDKHRECGQKCARNGQPVGLLTEDGSVFLLIDEEHDPRRDGLTTFRQFAVDNMANVVKINGTQSEVDKQKAIYVQGFIKK